MAKTQKVEQYDTLDEAQFYAERRKADGPLLPDTYARSAQICSIALEVPLFSIARRARNTQGDGQAAGVDDTWHRKGRGWLHYRGPQLTQSHQTLLLALLSRHRNTPVNVEIRAYPSQILDDMGWSVCRRNSERLVTLMDELMAGMLWLWGDVEDERTQATRARFVLQWKPSRTERWSILLSSDVMALFNGHQTFMALNKRGLMQEGLGTFLYGMIHSNNCALPFSYAQVHAASGSQTADMREFGKSARAVLEALKSAGLIADFKTHHGGFRVLRVKK